VNVKIILLGILYDKSFILHDYLFTEIFISKLVCILLNSWDGQREWSAELPDGEEICGIAVTASWVAVATSMQFLRLFTLSGGQREIVTIPGPIVAINGSRDRLVVVHHCGTRMFLLFTVCVI